MNSTRRFDSEEIAYSPEQDRESRARRRQHEQRKKRGDRDQGPTRRFGGPQARQQEHLPARFLVDDDFEDGYDDDDFDDEYGYDEEE